MSLKEYINKLSKGIFEYEAPIIETDVSSIELELERNTSYSGCIEVYSMNSLDIKGIAYSTNDRLTLIHPRFIGEHNILKYEVTTEYMQEGDIITGNINLVCNGSEFSIPYRIHVKSISFYIGNSVVNDIDSFVALYHNHYDEALSLFRKKEFKNIFTGQDAGYISIYDGLMGGCNKALALEEFLVGIDKKNKITLELSETEKTYTDLESSYADSIVVIRDYPGFVSFHIQSDAEFIEIEKKSVTSENFIGNRYELTYLINYNLLHAGYNFGCIRLLSNDQVFEYKITVNKNKNFDWERIELKKHTAWTFKDLIQKKIAEDVSIENKETRLIQIKEQYAEGCRSPLLYIDAMHIFNECPKYMHDLKDFEIHVLIFGMKYHLINQDFSRQITETASRGKDFDPKVFKILEYLYGRYNDMLTLDVICSMLIRGNKYGREYFKWFELGTVNELKITRLYDYYMYSISTGYTDLLPKNILMYFIYNADSLHEKQAFLYYNIIINKSKNDSLYRSYYKHIEKYALSEIKKENINEFLAVIYKDVLSEDSLDADILLKLPGLFYAYKLECKNSNILKVIISYDTLLVQNEFVLRNGSTYIEILTDNYHIFFEDMDGNRYYKTVDYTLSRLFEYRKLINACLAQNPNNKFFMINHLKDVLRNSKNHTKTISLFLTLSDDFFRKKQLKLMTREVLEYYYHNYDETIVDDFLILFDTEKMDKPTISMLFELMVMRRLFGEAYEIFKKFKDLEINPVQVLKLCKELLRDKEFEEDDTVLDLCRYTFLKNKYNEDTLKYLGKYYNGTTKELLDLWKALKDFDCENTWLEERLLSQMLFTKMYSNMRYKVYYSYYMKGAGEELRHAYINFESIEYYLKNTIVDSQFFILLEQELQKNFNINDICKITFLKYHLESKKLSDEQIKLIKKIILDLSERNIRLNFFKQYSRWMEIPYYLTDKLIIEYKADPKHKVFIHYLIDTGNSVKKPYIGEEMKSIYPGIFTKEFIIFYGENVLYYITEESGYNDIITESRNISLDDDELYLGESRYGILNNMVLSLEMNDEVTFKELSLQYTKNRYLSDNIFEIM